MKSGLWAKKIFPNHLGEEQAHKAARYFQDIEINKIVSSPLLRAHKTAEIINSYLNVPLSLHEDLKECGRGREEGLLTIKLKSHDDWLKGKAPQDGESIDEFQARIIQAVNNIIRHEKNILIVAHAGIFTVFMQRLVYSGRQAGNCVPYVFKPPKHKIHPWMIYKLIE